MDDWFSRKARADFEQRNNQIALVETTLLVAARKYDEGDQMGKNYWREKGLLFAREFDVTEDELSDSYAQRVFADVWWVPRV